MLSRKFQNILYNMCSQKIRSTIRIVSREQLYIYTKYFIRFFITYYILHINLLDNFSLFKFLSVWICRFIVTFKKSSICKIKFARLHQISIFKFFKEFPAFESSFLIFSSILWYLYSWIRYLFPFFFSIFYLLVLLSFS